MYIHYGLSNQHIAAVWFVLPEHMPLRNRSIPAMQQYGLHAVVIPLTHGIADLLQALLDSIQLPLEDDLNRIINVKK